MTLLAAAVENNAAWVAAVHRAHGHAGEAQPAVWLTRGRPLPFYPNAVTLQPGRAAEITVALRGLQAEIGRGWAVKDSYAVFDLAPLGFAPLFEAQWFARASLIAPTTAADALRWRRATTPEALAQWEDAWGGQAGAVTAPRLFPPALLADPDIAFLGGYAGEALAAGVIANHSGTGAQTVVGVSNLFLPPTDGERLRRGALAAASATFPGWPLVGYDHGPELGAMQALGFAVLGPLRVWAS